MKAEKQFLGFGSARMNSALSNSRISLTARTYFSGLFGLLVAAEVLGAQVSKLNSPDGRIEISIEMPAPASVEGPHWSATFRGKPILGRCALGLETVTEGDLMAGARVEREQNRSVDERVPVLFGKADHANDHFRERRYTLENARHRRTDVVFRCYDDAIAVRYELPAGEHATSVTITNETTSSAWKASRPPLCNISKTSQHRTSITLTLFPIVTFDEAHCWICRLLFPGRRTPTWRLPRPHCAITLACRSCGQPVPMN